MVDVALEVIQDIKPKILIIDEVIDAYALSRFNKDPRRGLDFQDEIDKTRAVLGKIRNALPDTEIKMVESNHDLRLQKYLAKKAPELCYLDNLSLYSLLDLGRYSITYLKDFEFRNILFKHGNIVRKDSGMTARAQQTKEGMSGASGHSHRLGAYFRTIRGGSYVWLEGGCMCNINEVEYIEGTADWQNGFVGFTFEDGKDRFYPFIVPIIEGKAIYGNKIYG